MTTDYAYLKYPRTTTPFDIVDNARRWIGQPVTSDEWRLLVPPPPTAAAVNEALAKMVQGVESEVLNAMPLMTQRVSSLTVAAGVRLVTLPTDMRGNDIIRLYWSDTGGEHDKYPVALMKLRDIQAESTEYLAGNVSEEWPQVAFIDPSSSGSLVFKTIPTMDKTLMCVNRVTPSTYAAADVADTLPPNTTRKIMAIPDALAKVTSFALARDLARTFYGVDSRTAMALEGTFQRELSNEEFIISNSPAELAEQSYNRPGGSGRTYGGVKEY